MDPSPSPPRHRYPRLLFFLHLLLLFLHLLFHVLLLLISSSLHQLLLDILLLLLPNVGDNRAVTVDRGSSVLDDRLLAGLLLKVHVCIHRLPASAENLVEALGKHPLVVKSKESREPKDDDNEADGDDDDDDVVGLLGVVALISGLSVRVARDLGVSGRCRSRCCCCCR